MSTGQIKAKPRRTAASPAQAEARPRKSAAAPQKRRQAPASAAKPAPAKPAPSRPVLHALVAAEQAVKREAVQVRLPLVGELRLPSRQDLAFLGGVAALTAIGVLEWPVALLLGVGHELAVNEHSKLLRSFGEALEEA